MTATTVKTTLTPNYQTTWQPRAVQGSRYLHRQLHQIK